MRNNVVKAGETDSEDYEKALERVYQDMMSRHNDPEIIRMREDNKKSLLGEGYSLWVKDILNLLQVYRNSTSDGERRGVWDHKPVMKEILPSYYRRDEVSSSGRQPVVALNFSEMGSIFMIMISGEIFPMDILWLQPDIMIG